MSEDYKPIDMGGYPYKQGDKLPGGITVILVVKGTDKDTCKGLICREILGVDRRNNPIYGEKVICKDHIDAMDGEKHENALKIVGIEPDPQKQWVYYNVEGEKRQQRARPDEFLKIVKGNSTAVTNPAVITEHVEIEDKSTEPEELSEDEAGPEPESQLCKGITKAGKACKRTAVEGEDYCSAHIGE